MIFPNKVFGFLSKCSRISSCSLLTATSRPLSTTSNVIIEPNKSNELLREMRREIAFKGPMNVHSFMRSALTHPKYGFYMNNDVFGSKGHFTTSPEVSQIFGELIGIWIAHEYIKSSSKLPLKIVEFGPGRGTLSSDIARVCNQLKATLSCEASFHLVEVSPFLIDKQRKTLCGDDGNLTKFGQKIQWYPSLEQVDVDQNAFSVYVSNEFLDAFPVYKFSKIDNQWHEILVDNHPTDMSSLRWIRAKNETPSQKIFLPSDLEGDHFEIAPEVGLVVSEVAKRVTTSPGCSLICDYGFDVQRDPTAKRDTLRAYKSHNPWDPLVDPGTADLTVDVDFDYVRARALEQGSQVFGTATQTQFLTNLGIGVRLGALLQSISDAQVRKDLISGVRMLIEDMGERFKFMAICSSDYQGPATGFENLDDHDNDEDTEEPKST